MFRKKNRSKKRSRAMLSAYSIIMILIILLGIISHVLPKAKFQAAPLEAESSEVEVGPGEWEGEMPQGGPAELNGEAPARRRSAVAIVRWRNSGSRSWRQCARGKDVNRCSSIE